MKTFKELKVGDKVYRHFGDDKIPAMELTVSAVSDSLVTCGDFEFETRHGLEVDEYLGWGELGSGSYITLK